MAWEAPKTRYAWIGLGICIAISLVLANFVVDAAAAKQPELLTRIELVVLGAVAVVAALAATGEAPWQEPDLRSWLQPKPLAMTLVAIFGAFGLLTGVISLMAPRSATESRAGEIERGVDSIQHSVGSIDSSVARLVPPPARVRAHIGRLWGLKDANCARTLRFTLKGDALRIEGVKEPAGKPHYVSTATVTSAKGDVLEARGNNDGMASTFTYTGNDMVESVTWRDHHQDSPQIDLEPCA